MEKQNGSAKLAKQKEIMKKVYSAFETGRTSDLENYVTNNMKEHIQDPSFKSTGIQLLKDQVELYHRAFPDLKIKINEMFGDGEKLTIYSTLTGTNKGSFMGIPPTNKKVSINAIEFVKFNEEKLSDHWGVYDMLSMMTQMGLVPSMDKLAKHEVHK